MRCHDRCNVLACVFRHGDNSMVEYENLSNLLYNILLSVWNSVSWYLLNKIVQNWH